MSKRNYKKQLVELPGELIPISQVPMYTGWRGKTQTITDWVEEGLNGIYLEAVRINNRIYTTDFWLHEFIRALSKTRFKKPSLFSVFGKKKIIAQAERELDDILSWIAKHDRD